MKRSGSLLAYNLKIIALLVLSCIIFAACSKERRVDKKGEKMQEFVIAISSYARSFDPNFVVIPQNGAELAFNFFSLADGLNQNYLSAIDGIGIEALFYNGTYDPDEERISMLQEIVVTHSVMVSEFVEDSNTVADAIKKNQDNGFICFPRSATNYDYLKIPDSVVNENSSDINVLADAKNYLYLINPADFATKKEFIDAIAATNFDLVLIDLFYGDDVLTTSDVGQLKLKANGGSRLVIAYMNIGSAENYRYYWQDDWKLHSPNWLKKEYEGYEDEIWVKFWKKDWQEIIFGNDDSYTKKIINAGFDGVYLDNVEAYYFLYYE